MTANDPDRPPQDGPLTNETVTSYLAAYRLLESEPPDPRSATERTKIAARPTPNVPKPSEGGKWRPPAPNPPEKIIVECEDVWAVSDSERLENMANALRRMVDAIQAYQHHAELGRLPHELKADLQKARRELICFQLAMAEGREPSRVGFVAWFRRIWKAGI